MLYYWKEDWGPPYLPMPPELVFTSDGLLHGIVPEPAVGRVFRVHAELENGSSLKQDFFIQTHYKVQGGGKSSGGGNCAAGAGGLPTAALLLGLVAWLRRRRAHVCGSRSRAK